MRAVEGTRLFAATDLSPAQLQNPIPAPAPTEDIYEAFLDPHSETGRSMLLLPLLSSLSTLARRVVLELPSSLLDQAKAFAETRDRGVMTVKVLDARGEVVGACSTRMDVEEREESNFLAAEEGEEEERWWPRGGEEHQPMDEEEDDEDELDIVEQASDAAALDVQLAAMVLRAREAQALAAASPPRHSRLNVAHHHPADRTDAAAHLFRQLDPSLSASSPVFHSHTLPPAFSSPPPPARRRSSPTPTSPPRSTVTLERPHPGTGLGAGWAAAAGTYAETRRLILARHEEELRRDGGWRGGEEVEVEQAQEGEVLEIRPRRVQGLGRAQAPRRDVAGR